MLTGRTSAPLDEMVWLDTDAIWADPNGAVEDVIEFDVVGRETTMELVPTVPGLIKPSGTIGCCPDWGETVAQTLMGIKAGSPVSSWARAPVAKAANAKTPAEKKIVRIIRFFMESQFRGRPAAA